jgi:hypothetical protein
MFRITLLAGVIGVLALIASSTPAKAQREVIVDDRYGTTTTIIEVQRTELRCDGVDSTRVVLTKTRADGSPAAGDYQLIGVSSGSFSVKNGVPGPYSTYTYDAAGQIQFRAVPTNNGRGWWDLYLPAYLGERGGHHAFACPFTDDRTYSISGEVWRDGDTDGVRDRREPNLSGIGIKIQCVGCYYFFGVPWHYQKTDKHGEYEWLGLGKGGFQVSAPWEMCLDDRAARRWHIVSVDGAAVTPTSCITVYIAQPGDQYRSLGIAKR